MPTVRSPFPRPSADATEHPIQSMLVNLNGIETTVPDGSTVADLLAALGARGRLAIEVNGAIVPRSEHHRRVLGEGDCIEVVRAIGGG